MTAHAHRRDFLKSSLGASTLVAMGASTVPAFLGRSALAARSAAATGGDRVLVVVQLIGGNDGLNTVVPHGLDGYGAEPPGTTPARGDASQDDLRDRTASCPRAHRQASRRRAARGGAGGGLPEPRSLALPLDGDLGNRPGSKPAPSRPAGWAEPSMDFPRRPATIAPRSTSAAGPSPWRCGRSGPRSRRSPASSSTGSSSAAATATAAPAARRSTRWRGSTGRVTIRCSAFSAAAP